MTSVPETKYANSGNVSIAYQVMGDGPMDLIIVPGSVSNVEFSHELPGYTRCLEQLAAFARVVTFDKRGNGMSDRVERAPSLEVRMDDVRAVMDAVGSVRAALMGVSEGGPMSMLFAATYPERVQALVLYATFASMSARDDWPPGVTPLITDNLEMVRDIWGRDGGAVELMAPSVASIPEWRDLWAKFERYSATPATMVALFQMNSQIDVRSLLPAIRVPTLVLHRRDDRCCPLEGARRMAEAIPGARFVELEGEDHFPYTGDSGAIVAEVEEFLTGQRHEAAVSERVLATALLTDIVASTERATKLGDSKWRQLLDAHDELATRQLRRCRGRLVKSTGDGILATFDGPARAINCASAMRDGVRALGLEIRAGLHTGEIELRGDDIGGIAVHIAARVLSKAQPGEVLVSRTLTDLVAGSDLRFEDRGEHELKGVAEKWHLFAAQA
jgi:pimeloyl-ACP methyl ester carboxylesterase